MNETKKKEKRIIPLRTSGETIVKVENRPSKVLYDLAQKAEEITLSAAPTIPYPLLPPTTRTETSPVRDYTKVANSIARDAVPSGLFKGTSKETYDVLYLRTRGAINPTRIIKAVQSDILMWTDVSHNTLRAHLKHLQSVGLVKIHYKLGDNNGAEYEVFMPEEIDLSPYHPLPPPTTSQNVGGGTTQNLVVGGGGVMPENIGSNDSPKTSFKDINTIDDEAFADFVSLMTEISRKLTNKNPSKNEKEKWRELAELLAMELEIAVARTNSISSVPAFLTEHLRRRLISKIDAPRFKTGKSSAVDETQPAAVEPFVAEPLSTGSREVVLKTFKEYVEKGQRDFVMSFEETYTNEDWLFLMENLE